MSAAAEEGEGDRLQCENCEAFEALYDCAECKQKQCHDCDRAFHQSKRCKDHVRVDMDPARTQLVLAQLGQVKEVKATEKCPLCDKGVPDTQTYLEGVGRRWHVECLKCEECQEAKEDRKYIFLYNRPFCSVECVNKFVPVKGKDYGDYCAACHKHFLPGVEMVEQLGQKWHAEHWCCGNCKKDLGENFVVRCANEDIAYCTKECAEAAVCPGCSKLVPPSYAATVAMDHRWHDACFVCQDCTQPVTGQFGAIAGKPICVDCIETRKKARAQPKTEETEAKAKDEGQDEEA